MDPQKEYNAAKLTTRSPSPPPAPWRMQGKLEWCLSQLFDCLSNVILSQAGGIHRA